MNDIEIMQELKQKISQLEDYIKRLEKRCVNQLKIINKNNDEYIKIEKVVIKAQKQEKLLELYRYLDENTNDYDLHPDKVDEIYNKIEELENE